MSNPIPDDSFASESTAREPVANLLDLIDELSDLPPGRRGRRLDELKLSEGQRRQVEKWLGAAADASKFLNTIPADVAMSAAQDQTLAADFFGSSGGGGDNAAPTIPGYRIDAFLGRGAMGTVWKAHDTKLQRDVAVKALAARPQAGSPAAGDSLREARAAAKLIHPNTATIFQVIETGGRICIVMELLDGSSLAEWIVEHGPMPWREATVAIRDAVAGLQAAHEAGLVHRDIKPSNLMRTSRGRVKVVDFGVAHNDAGTMMTQAGSLIGTPAYMSPEQCEGKPADARSDIYSIGCTYFHLLTGQIPFGGQTATAVMYQHCHAEAPDLREGRPELSDDLCAIVGKCMAKKPADRYASAEALLAGLDALLNPLPLVTLQLDQTLAARKPIVRRRRYVGKIAVAAVIGLAVYFSVAAYYRRPSHAPIANGAAPTPIAAKPIVAPPPAFDAAGRPIINLLPFIDVDRDTAIGKWTLDNGALVGSAEEGTVYPISKPLESYWMILPYTPPEEYDLRVSFTASEFPANGNVELLLSHAGIRFQCFIGGAYATHQMGFEGAPFNAQSHSPTNPSVTTQPAVLDSGRRYSVVVHVRLDSVSADLDGKAVLKHFTDYKGDSNLLGTSRLGVAGRAGKLVFHSIEIVDISGRGNLTARKADDPRLVRRFEAVRSQIKWIEFSPDDRRVLSRSGIGIGGMVRSCDMATSARTQYLCGAVPTFSENGRFMVVGPSSDMHILETGTGKTIGKLRLDNNVRVYTALTDDGSVMAIAPIGDDALMTPPKISLWDVVHGKLSREIGTDAQKFTPISGIVFSSDGQRLASYHFGDVVRLWNVGAGVELWHRQIEATATSKMGEVAFSPDGSALLAMPAYVSSTSLLESENGTVVANLKALTCAFSGVTPFIVGIDGGLSDSLRLFDRVSGADLNRFACPPGRRVAAAFTPKGDRVLAADEGGAVHLFDVASGKLLATFLGHDNTVRCFAFSHDGRLAATAGDDRTVCVWRLPE